jgi:hypothetical protein
MSDTTTLVTTRRSLHAVGELVLAGPQHAATNEISLRALPGGFGTTHSPDLRVVGTDVVGPDATVGITGLTPASLAAAVGVEARGLKEVYPDGSGFALDDVLEVDPDAAAVVAAAFAAGDQAMRALASDQTPILWPEHFDIGITVDEVNYGVSPGDRGHRAPYASVGPWTPRTGTFWNASFGALRPATDLPTAEAVAAFFAAGRSAAGSAGRGGGGDQE